MRNHVTQYLTAYVDGRLNHQRRVRVAQHLARCEACRAALAREQDVSRELAALMPGLGQPEPGQLRRLFPAIMAEVRSTPSHPLRLAPSVGVMLAMLLICAFSVSAFFGGATHAIAAPNPHFPSDVQATNTPVRTDEPSRDIDEPSPSQTARAFILPNPSPVPNAIQAGK